MFNPELVDLTRGVSMLLNPPNSAITRTLLDHMPLSQPECLRRTNLLLRTRDLPQIAEDEMDARVRSLVTSGLIDITVGDIILTRVGLSAAQFLRGCASRSAKDKG